MSLTLPFARGEGRADAVGIDLSGTLEADAGSKVASPNLRRCLSKEYMTSFVFGHETRMEQHLNCNCPVTSI